MGSRVRTNLHWWWTVTATQSIPTGSTPSKGPNLGQNLEILQLEPNMSYANHLLLKKLRSLKRAAALSTCSESDISSSPPAKQCTFKFNDHVGCECMVSMILLLPMRNAYGN
eukprot:Clim_evm13s14 gene=Clim_evmTU13s14